jgi:transcriptional regulator with XRE-family HTH domain
MTDNEKIRAIRSSLDLTMDAFGKRIGVSRSAISNIENGNRGITNQLATSICREFNVNPDYLAGESEVMFLELSRSDELAAFFGDVLKDDDEDFRKRFISALAQFTEEDWKLFEKIFDKMAKEKD